MVRCGCNRPPSKTSPARLEELGYLASFLGRLCRGRAQWGPALREFGRGVDEMVMQRHGGAFAPVQAFIA